VRLLTEALKRHIANGYPVESNLLRKVQREVVSQLHVLAGSMGSSLGEVVDRYFLFTVMGVVLARDTATFFALGDGVVCINGELTVLEAEEGNRPVYLGYALTGSSLVDHDPSKLEFKILEQMPLDDLKNFLIGTDGMNEWITRSEENIPGTDTPLGPIEQFWLSDRFFKNPIAIQMLLNRAARDHPRRQADGTHVLEGGKLSDDTTLVVGRQLNIDQDD
jgi:hypothetical protein